MKDLLQEKVISSILTRKDVDFFKQDVLFKEDKLYLDDMELCSAHLLEDSNDQIIYENCLGEKLNNAMVIKGVFFLGPQKFYKKLRELTEEERKLVHMKSVRSIIQFYGHEGIDRLHRVDVRFLNTVMKVTLTGEVCSDALEDGGVVSRVGVGTKERPFPILCLIMAILLFPVILEILLSLNMELLIYEVKRTKELLSLC